MLISKGQKRILLKMSDSCRVLELMYDGEEDLNLYFEGIQERETIEEEPDIACLLTCTTAYENAYKHSVMCGNAHSYLLCKAKRKECFEAIVVHADKMYCSSDIWHLIGALRPTWVLILYKNMKKGELHKKMMTSCGFELAYKGGENERNIYVGRNKSLN